jgi:hypothetical protein
MYTAHKKRLLLVLYLFSLGPTWRTTNILIMNRNIYRPIRSQGQMPFSSTQRRNANINSQLWAPSNKICIRSLCTTCQSAALLFQVENALASPPWEPWQVLISECDWRRRGPPPPRDLAWYFSGQSFALILDERLVRRSGGGAAVPDFLATMVIVVAAKMAWRLVRGTWYGSTPHLRVLRVVLAMPAEISGLLLEAGGRQRGGVPICLIKKAILGFLSRQDGVLLDTDPYWSSRWSVMEGSTGDLYWTPGACRLLDPIGFSHVHPYFWPCGFRREWREVSLFVAIIEDVGFRFLWRRQWWRML